MAVAQADVGRLHQEAPARGIQVIWSASTGSVKPSVAVQQQITEIASQLEAQARVRELLRLRVTTNARGAEEIQSGEIGLRIHSPSDDGLKAATVDLLFNGDNGLTREVVTALPLDELRSRLLRLLRVYTVEGCAKDTFATWSRGQSDADLRSRLGISEQTVVSG
jgi:hypothetical protein